MAVLVAVAGAYAIARIADQGLADFRGLKTLRHGTDPIGWVKIHTLGIRPHYDQSKFGKILDHNPSFALASSSSDYGITLPRIEVRKETLSFLPEWIAQKVVDYNQKIQEYRITQFAWRALERSYPIVEKTPLVYLFKKTLMHGIPLGQKFVASLNRVHQTSPIQGPLKATAAIAFSLLSCVLTPTIKVRVTKTDDLSDPTNFNIIRLAKKNLSIFDIGLLGTIKNGSLIPPLLSQPMSVFKGVVQLTFAGGIAYGAIVLFPGFVATQTTAIVAGVVLGCI